MLRKKKVLINCVFAPIRRNGIKKLYELCTEAEIEQDMNEIVRIGSVLAAFPQPMIELSGAYDENSNNEERAAVQVMERWGEWMDLNNISFKVKIAIMLLLVKCYDNKMVKSPCNLVNFLLTQPQVANQQQQKKNVKVLTNVL